MLPARLSASCAILLFSSICEGAEGRTPVVSRLHTLSIHVRSHAVHESVYALLSEVLLLPPTYDPVTYGQRKYAAVQAGNLCLEPCGPFPDHLYSNTDFEGKFYGLTFEPYESATASARELDRRGIRHGTPTQSVRITDKDISAPDVTLGIGEKESQEARHGRAAKLSAQNGGPIGLSHVEEILVGYSDNNNLNKWVDFLRPAKHEGGNVYSLSDGLALRFVKHDSKRVIGITLKVRSLDQARAFLKKNGLLGRVRPDEVEFNPSKIHGLRIVLKE